jgi:hypothetical protein
MSFPTSLGKTYFVTLQVRVDTGKWAPLRRPIGIQASVRAVKGLGKFTTLQRKNSLGIGPKGLRSNQYIEVIGTVKPGINFKGLSIRLQSSDGKSYQVKKATLLIEQVDEIVEK